MSAIKLTVHGTGSGVCALAGKESDGLTVTFENEPQCFVSWRAFKQLLSFKTAQNAKPELRPNGATPAVTAVGMAK